MKENRAMWPLELIATVLIVSVAGFYRWLVQKPTLRQIKRQQAAIWVTAAHEETRRSYGAIRLHRHLSNQGVALSRYLVRRLPDENGLYCKRHKRYKKYIHYYNNDRIKMKLGGLSPITFRMRALSNC